MKKISTPWWIYLILLLIAIICIIPYNAMSDAKNCLWDIFCNIGYGIFSSLVIAFLIDLATTSAKKKIDMEKLHIISAEYRTAFLNLRDCVINASELRYGSDGKKRSFNDWMDYVLAPINERQGETDEDVFESVRDIQFHIERIEKTATTLYELLLLHLDNKCITNEYRYNVKSVCSLAAHIDKLLESEKYEHAIKTIKERLIPRFLKDNEDYKHYFIEPYCEDRFTED